MQGRVATEDGNMETVLFQKLGRTLEARKDGEQGSFSRATWKSWEDKKFLEGRKCRQLNSLLSQAAPRQKNFQ